MRLSLLVPLAARAQGSIAGSVKDPSGGVLPGVTVEASSDALIEKTRTVVTDGAGNYRIVDLPPGTYAVTFTLTGFKTVRREGILIQGTFSAPVSEQMQVGALEETITVSGTPTVDVSNNTAQFVVDRDILDAIPTPIRNTPARALLLPGTNVTPFVLGQYNMSVHGSNTADMVIAIDGMRVNNLCGSGQFSGFFMNDASVEEVTFTTGAESAEMQNGGLRINSTPKDGGNRFSGTFFAYGAGSGLQADNRTDAMKTGPAAIAQPGIAYLWQINPSFGGPLKRDKLWFYATYKYEDNKTYVASSTFADGSRAYRQAMGNYSGVGRITWQASQRDKIRFYLEKQFNGEFYNGFNTLPTTTPEASTDAFGRGWVPQVKWTQTTSNKLLLEAGVTYYTSAVRTELHQRRRPARSAAARTDDQPSECGRGQHHSDLHQLDQDLQLDGIGQLHHRLARLQGRHDHELGHQLAHVLVERADQHAGVQQRLPRPPAERDQPRAVRRVALSDRRPREQRADDPGAEGQEGPRLLRAGHLDDEQADAEPGRTLRPVQRRSAGGVVTGGHLDPGARLRCDPQRPELEGLVGAWRRRLRSVRQRQDRDQGERQQIHRVGRRWLCAELQRHELLHADARRGSTSMATSRSSTRRATSSSRK